MKNIHLLQTDKPSRLVLDTINNNLFLTTTKDSGTKIMQFQNIYITSDDAKEGDWCVDKHNVVYKQETDKIFPKFTGSKKIILTTDQDLIKDGVQAIDDEFLEWFVENQDCEKVKVEKENICARCYCNDVNDCWSAKECSDGKFDKIKYKIIFSKENHLIEYTNTNDCTFMIYNQKEEPKQETLEEAAKKHSEQFDYAEDSCPEEAFILGAKWQAERMYSDLSELRNDLYDKLPIGDVDAFEILKVIKNHLQKLDALCGNK
jgi:hypothetical protein